MPWQPITDQKLEKLQTGLSMALKVELIVSEPERNLKKPREER
jgi:hypothetical protein